MDGRSDGQTDIRKDTPSYRDARMHLKEEQNKRRTLGKQKTERKEERRGKTDTPWFRTA